MTEFIGTSVKLRLRGDPQNVVYGQVKEVVAGSTLTLQNAHLPHVGAHYSVYTVPGNAIADLQVVAALPDAALSLPGLVNGANATNDTIQHVVATLPQLRAAAEVPRVSAPLAFVDPAIVSYEKSPIPERYEALVEENLPTSTAAHRADAQTVLKPVGHEAARPYQPEATTSQRETPMLGPLQVNSHLKQSTREFRTDEASSKKKARRATKKKGHGAPMIDPPPVMNTDVSRNGNDMDANITRGMGWRQTPLLQPSELPASPQKKRTGDVSHNSRSKSHTRNNNGWATEDATDIQDMGDFDFEANHRLFDKQQVFSQIREADETADSDRLVSHNRLPRPGTGGGKNLHPSENVLSPRLGPRQTTEIDNSSDADTELNGRSSSRHSFGRASVNKQISRQSSAHVDGKLGSHISDRSLAISPSASSMVVRGGRDISVAATPSPRLEMTHSPQSAIATNKITMNHSNSSQNTSQKLVIVETGTHCPVIFPEALNVLEIETVSRIGMTQEAVTESAARSIAETAISTMNSAHRMENGGLSVAVILVGNHTIGARALAAVRHLICRKLHVIVAEAPYDSSQEMNTQAKVQMAMIKRLIKNGAPIRRGSWRRASHYIKNLSGPPAIILDVLLAGAPYQDLGQGDAVELREMIEWANRSRAPVLSVACPSGVSGADGTALVVDGEPLAVRSDTVLCLGLPVRGLLFAMKNGEKWRDVRLADVGLNLVLRNDEMVDFGTAWIVNLKYSDSI